ncbi:alkaline phosphatase synthesis sensor protein PhoR [Sphingomonas mucosissima]|uniref:histidine kinase n=1 Tax=Sphingomonas mucosissima TaxID=370959 RepID=A0A245ZSU2_9SPHN|nr:ATP-binding protein [Sphingomonas mucosissima]OWK32797.1 alkaline phosphatase synthesis sensor protein PhoR [Sphingomonas mucosissima]
MSEIISPRGWTAFGIVAVTAVILSFIGACSETIVVSAAGGVAAVLASAAGRSRDDERLTPSAPPVATSPLEPVLDAFGEPVLILSGPRIEMANGAARTLLGAYIVGEDARIAIRHPAASGLLADQESGGPVALTGLGSPAQRWEIQIAPIGDGRRLVHLTDRSGSHAAERMRVDFVANASHELRTPLASILGYVETLSDAAGEDPVVRARFLKIVFDEARRMQRLVDDLMSLSRIEAEKFRAPSDTVDLGALVDETHAELAEAHDGRGRDIILEHDPGAIPVLGDRTQLSQLLHNLIGNAMKYGQPGTPVRVAITRENDAVRLVVADQGEGIPPEHLPRLTERFYRVDPGRSRSVGGTGLGLAIVKHIVERHRGRLEITSRVGEGTRVTVVLRPPPAAVAEPLS